MYIIPKSKIQLPSGNFVVIGALNVDQMEECSSDAAVDDPQTMKERMRLTVFYGLANGDPEQFSDVKQMAQMLTPPDFWMLYPEVLKLSGVRRGEAAATANESQ